MTVFRRAFMTGSIAWAALLPLAPFAAAQPVPADLWHMLAFVMYSAGSIICHQLPERSFHLWAAQLPVCARCTGIYVGGGVAAAVFGMVRLSASAREARYGETSPKLREGGKLDATDGQVRLKPDTPYDARLLLAIAAVPTVVTLVYEWTAGETPSNAIRAFAGVPLGAAVAYVLVRALR